MTGQGRPRFSSCPCTLHRDHTPHSGEPCRRVLRRDGGLEVRDGFYDEPDLRAALASYDLGTVFRFVRLHFGMSQAELAELVELDQPKVCNIENGRIRLEKVGVVARVADRLGIPGRLLGFGPASVGDTPIEEEVSWLHRRRFFQTAAGVTLGVTSFSWLERLDTLRPRRTERPEPKFIGEEHVRALRKATVVFRESDYEFGGGLLRAAAQEKLCEVLQYEKSTCTDDVRTSLQLATAELAMTTAWMSYDVEDHLGARELWVLALDYARRAEHHPRSADLTVGVLLDTAHQALHRQEPKEALRLVQLANATAGSHEHPISDSTRSYLAANLAWCRASLGHVDACRRALDAAEQAYNDRDLAAAPPWAAHVVPAEVAAQRGHALFLLARTDPAFAEDAIAHLSAAVTGYGEPYARSAAVNLPGLASSQFYVGDVEAALATGHQAVTAISTLSSKRTYARLSQLSDAAKTFAHNADVADLRARIEKVVTAA